MSEIVVESKEDAEGEEEGEGGDKVPHVVVIVKIEQDAIRVLLSRHRRTHVPGEWREGG